MSMPSENVDSAITVAWFGDIPVALHPMWGLVVVIAIARGDTLVEGVALTFAYTISVMVHELGHAAVCAAYGLVPRVVVHAFGGYTAHLPAQTARQQIWISAAGPAAGLLLAAAALAAMFALPPDPPVGIQLLVYASLVLNVFWSLMNLLPVLPLDGGQLLAAILTAARGPGAALRWVPPIGTVTAVITALGAAAMNMWLLAALFGWLAFTNGRTLVR